MPLRRSPQQIMTRSTGRRVVFGGFFLFLFLYLQPRIHLFIVIGCALFTLYMHVHPQIDGMTARSIGLVVFDFIALDYFSHINIIYMCVCTLVRVGTVATTITTGCNVVLKL